MRERKMRFVDSSPFILEQPSTQKLELPRTLYAGQQHSVTEKPNWCAEAKAERPGAPRADSSDEVLLIHVYDFILAAKSDMGCNQRSLSRVEDAAQGLQRRLLRLRHEERELISSV